MTKTTNKHEIKINGILEYVTSDIEQLYNKWFIYYWDDNILNNNKLEWFVDGKLNITMGKR